MKIKLATEKDKVRIQSVIRDLRVARVELQIAGAVKAAKAVSRALKSAEGALRHVERRIAACKVCGRASWAHVDSVMCEVK